MAAQYQNHYRELQVQGLQTRFMDAGDGAPLVLLHGGEFGASAELGWERVIGPLSKTRRVIAPDVLGYGGSAKVLDFVDGRGMRIRHVAALLTELGISKADFVGNSMGAVMLLNDAASEQPALPVHDMVVICGGGEILTNEHSAALYDYDASLPAMRRIVTALFHDAAYAEDADYIQRRFDSSTAPGAWEAVAAARFRRPGRQPSTSTVSPDYSRVRPRALIVEGEFDKLKPKGWAAEIAAAIPGAASAVVRNSGHCPQIEQPEATLELLMAFFGD